VTARALRGVDTISDAASKVEPADTVQVLYLNGIPRAGLTAREISETYGLPYRWIMGKIHEGRVRVIHEGLREYIIPVSELAEIAKWAEYLGRPE
jgi:hypothetical protein